MSGVKGKSGGLRNPPGGRPKYRTDAEIRRELQKRVPKALEAIDKRLDNQEEEDAWKVINKFVGDRKVNELENSDKGPLLIKIAAEKHNE